MLLEDYFEDHGLERIELPDPLKDLNPIEHIWVYVMRYVADALL